MVGRRLLSVVTKTTMGHKAAALCLLRALLCHYFIEQSCVTLIGQIVNHIFMLLLFSFIYFCGKGAKKKGVSDETQEDPAVSITGDAPCWPFLHITALCSLFVLSTSSSLSSVFHTLKVICELAFPTRYRGSVFGPAERLQ